MTVAESLDVGVNATQKPDVSGCLWGFFLCEAKLPSYRLLPHIHCKDVKVVSIFSSNSQLLFPSAPSPHVKLTKCISFKCQTIPSTTTVF